MNFVKKSTGMLAVLAIVVATGVLFQTAFAETWKSWQQEEYSHGYLVPLVGLMLLLYRAKDVTAVRQNSWWGLAGVLFCLACLFLFEVAGTRGIQPLLLVSVLYAIFLTFYGVRFSLAMAAPLGFFMFLVPLPKIFYYKLSFGMQMISTDLSVLMLQMADISMYQEGNVIDLGIIKMEVAEACNGLRYLFPLMALGYLMAFMYKAPFGKRALVFFSTIPITIFLNSLRIFLIGVSANIWGAEIASGIVHDVEGWAVFFACFLVLILEIIVLQKIGKREHIDFDCFVLPGKESFQQFFTVQWRMPAKLLVGVLVVFACAFSVASAKGWGDIKPVPLERSFAFFPMQIGPWLGRTSLMDAQSLDVLGTEDYLLADYQTREGDSVNLYILYYDKQDSTSNQAVHSPAVCIPSGGWFIVSHDQVVLETLKRQSKPVNRLVIHKGMERQLVYYWFYQGDNITTDAFHARLSIIGRTIRLRQSNGGMIRLLTPIFADEDVADAEGRLQAFFNSSYNTIEAWVY